MEPPLSRRGRLYVTCVIGAGVLALSHSLHRLYLEPSDNRWIVFAALTLVSGSFTVRIPQVPSSISVSETLVIMTVLLFGTAPATITAALEALVISLWLLKNTEGIYRVFFNMASASISIWTASRLFFWVHPTPLQEQPDSIVELLLPLVLFTVVYFLINSWLVVIAVGLHTRGSAARIWRDSYAWLSLNYFGGASVAALMIPFTRQINLTSLGLIIPLLAISYFTFKTAMGRVEDAHRHLAQLNKLHLSTIETLAMAIDAKDQITHGHIRRVQLYAVRLARALGVTDESLIKAIEAAALLHDMGKLAVPEYILNKPGKLTTAEFEKMKVHASVGADILSAIDFPYPVVPIVRHHHESWNGTGYPDGLAGTDIPIGARILSVVDCFDALTSDRPYRPRLSDEASLSILIERRATMYDPLVVDTFIKVHAEIAPTPLDLGTHKQSLTETGRSPYRPASPWTSTARLDEITASTEETRTLYDLAAALAGESGLSEAGDAVSNHLRRIVPAALLVVYTYDANADELHAAYASGEGEGSVKGLRIQLGQRLTGWVGANRQTIVNSDPILDLGETARSMKPRLRSCLSTPLITEGSLVGVLTLYSTAADGFTDDHRRIIEAATQQVSHAVRRAVEFDGVGAPSLRDAVTGVPNLDHLRQFLTADTNTLVSVPYVLTLLFIDVDHLELINKRFGRKVGDAVLALTVDATRRTLRNADLLFRAGSDEFIVLLTQTDAATAESIATRIRANVRSAPHALDDGSSLRVDVRVGIATAPNDGTSLGDLLEAARHRLPRSSPAPPLLGEPRPGIH